MVAVSQRIVHTYYGDRANAWENYPAVVVLCHPLKNKKALRATADRAYIMMLCPEQESNLHILANGRF